MHRLFALLTALALVPLTGAASRAEEKPVVVELFTSQGCSSCPPADALADTLSREPGLLILTLHVDYWDYLGWRDRFARPENTRRQKAYTAMFHARSVYTPQAIVQGSERLVGSDAPALVAAIQAQRALPSIAHIELVRRSDSIDVKLSSAAPIIFRSKGILHLVTYDEPQTVRIERGENAGKTVVYTNVVRDWMKLGVWDGRAPMTISAPMPSMGKGLAVILQDGKVGPILASAWIEP
ncbi:DUF1223 domain-containing protein [Paroceanicella profunda]|uniref:DUF1223 domain-containing protein n=1 Tax=Paroceanicella profunda TaxID=2579971 RepID=A0A5B8FYV6_9RHOB|nr:DUF1223 domain-containing protein [Paroceanicella profunda]QDL92844.1 DUF1223 domain-containing protein [Paroceanicella profunda]